MTAWLANPGWVLIAAGLILPLLPLPLRRLLPIVAPLAAAAWLLSLPQPLRVDAEFLGLTLTPLRLDGLSFVFALIFLVAGSLAGIYMSHLRLRLEPAAALVYGGAAVAAVLAGDLITLFVYWEITAIASTLIILADGPQNHAVARRYLLVQVSSGLLLVAGAVVHVQATGSAAFDALGTAAPGGWLILLAFGIKAAFPLLHNWLQDTYPAASPSGTVVLSAFTTKMAIYALARGYAGSDILIPIGTVMALFPVFYAVVENELRRVLSYSLNVQLGFMVVAVGIGTETAINGAAAHAVTHVLYKALLFMSLGAVYLRVGTVRATELGGIWRSMPFTAAMCIVGAASISAVPLLSGYVSKSLIFSAVAYQGLALVWVSLLFASACGLLYVGIKVPYFAFFAGDSGQRYREAPPNMLLAMALTAAACIGLGCLPGLLYQLLPYPVDYDPYSGAKVLGQMQLLLFSALAFALLLRRGVYPQQQLRSTHLDSDWLYRRLAPRVWQAIAAQGRSGLARLSALGHQLWARTDRHLLAAFAEHRLTAPWPTAASLLLLLAMLGAWLLQALS